MESEQDRLKRMKSYFGKPPEPATSKPGGVQSAGEPGKFPMNRQQRRRLSALARASKRR